MEYVVTLVKRDVSSEIPLLAFFGQLHQKGGKRNLDQNAKDVLSLPNTDER